MRFINLFRRRRIGKLRLVRVYRLGRKGEGQDLQR